MRQAFAATLLSARTILSILASRFRKTIHTVYCDTFLHLVRVFNISLVMRAAVHDGRPDDLAESRLKGVEQTLIAARSRHQITGVFVVADRELLILPVRLLESSLRL
jgi:hypothetical protein